MIEVGQQVCLNRDVSRMPLTVRKIASAQVDGHPEWGRLLVISRGVGDMGATFWEDEVTAVTE